MSTIHMNTIWLVPLEPLESRYTGQWYNEFPKVFGECGYDVKVIDGIPLVDYIDKGSWLPLNSSAHYKSTQLAEISKLFQDNKVKNNDIFFVFDIEFHGIETIRALATLNKIKITLTAFLHAASYTKEDLMEQLAPWQKYTELGWLGICDRVFVGSEYHKQAVIERRIIPFADKNDIKSLSDRIIVTGNPLFEDAYHTFGKVKKKNQIILPNRFDYEKRPNISLDIAYLLKKRNPECMIIVTTSNLALRSNADWLLSKAREMESDGIIEIHEGLSKEQYHYLLAESKVMLTNSIEENFGYSIVEAIVYKTIPIAPKGLSHSEMLPSLCLFDNIDEVIGMIEEKLDDTVVFDDMDFNLFKYFNAADMIVRETLKV